MKRSSLSNDENSSKRPCSLSLKVPKKDPVSQKIIMHVDFLEFYKLTIPFKERVFLPFSQSFQLSKKKKNPFFPKNPNIFNDYFGFWMFPNLPNTFCGLICYKDNPSKFDFFTNFSTQILFDNHPRCEFSKFLYVNKKEEGYSSFFSIEFKTLINTYDRPFFSNHFLNFKFDFLTFPSILQKDGFQFNHFPCFQFSSTFFVKLNYFKNFLFPLFGSIHDVYEIFLKRFIFHHIFKPLFDYLSDPNYALQIFFGIMKSIVLIQIFFYLLLQKLFFILFMIDLINLILDLLLKGLLNFFNI